MMGYPKGWALCFRLGGVLGSPLEVAGGGKRFRKVRKGWIGWMGLGLLFPRNVKRGLIPQAEERRMLSRKVNGTSDHHRSLLNERGNGKGRSMIQTSRPHGKGSSAALHAAWFFSRRTDMHAFPSQYLSNGSVTRKSGFFCQNSPDYFCRNDEKEKQKKRLASGFAKDVGGDESC